MKTFIYYIAERVPGEQEMQRFAHPIHVGVVNAHDLEAAYGIILDDLRPTFSDSPQPLDIRFEEMAPPRDGNAGGVWRHRHPVDMDVTFTSDD